MCVLQKSKLLTKEITKLNFNRNI